MKSSTSEHIHIRLFQTVPIETNVLQIGLDKGVLEQAELCLPHRVFHPDSSFIWIKLYQLGQHNSSLFTSKQVEMIFSAMLDVLEFYLIISELIICSAYQCLQALVHVDQISKQYIWTCTPL